MPDDDDDSDNARGVPGLAGPGPRVLLVDDHADSREVTARLLRHAGYAVNTATSVAGAEATFAAVAGAGFDVLICDLQLPDGWGWDMLVRLRQSRPGLVAIAVSGQGTSADVERSTRAGFAAHLSKPFRFARLTEAIRRCT